MRTPLALEGIELMKVGDLVKKKTDTTYHKNLTGIIIEMGWDTGGGVGPTCKVAWRDYGIFWTPIIQLEVINESR